MATMNVLDAVGSTVAVEKPLAPGQALMAASRPVVIASDQSPLPVSGTVNVSGTIAVAGTFWQTTQPVSVAALPALAAGTAIIGKVGLDQSTPGTTNAFSIGYIGSTAVATGNGVVGAGVQRVAIASDNTAIPANVSQFGGNAPNLGAGSVGTGTLRITQASDSPEIAALGAPADAAWASGSGSQIALLKTIAGAALDTTTASPVSLRQPCDVIAVTPTLDTSIYASGDVLFVTTAITGAVRANDERSMLNSVAVVDKDDQKPALRLLFFKSNVTFGTLNAAPSISDSDGASYLGHVDIAAADYVDLGGVSVACAKSIGLLLESASGTTIVYVAGMLTAGTPTHTASGLVFNFGVVQS